MVAIHAALAGVEPPRVTDDGDVVVDVRVFGRQAMRDVASALTSIDFKSADAGRQGCSHRATGYSRSAGRELIAVDVRTESPRLGPGADDAYRAAAQSRIRRHRSAVEDARTTAQNFAPPRAVDTPRTGFGLLDVFNPRGGTEPAHYSAILIWLAHTDARLRRGQLSSYASSSWTRAVSTCCWKCVTLPSASVQTCAIFTSAGTPEVMCFH